MFTYETYQKRGYFVEHYRKLSFWQRLRGIVIEWKHERYSGIFIINICQYQMEGYQLFPHWYNPTCWEFGIVQTQNFDIINVAFINVLFKYK